MPRGRLLTLEKAAPWRFVSCGGLRCGTHLEGGTAVQLVAYGLFFG